MGGCVRSHVLVVAGAFVIAVPAVSPATSYNFDLGFKTAQRQSAWGTGAAARVADTIFLGNEWGTRSAKLGGVTGSVGQQRFQREEWTSWRICQDGAEKIGLDCPFPEPTRYETRTVDNRRGAEIGVRLDPGRAGVEIDFTADAGSVGAELSLSARAALPAAPERGTFFDLAPDAQPVQGSLDAQSPTLKAALNAIVDVNATVDWRACSGSIPFVPIQGCIGGSNTTPEVDQTVELISIDGNEARLGAGLFPTNPLSGEDGYSAQLDLRETNIAFGTGISTTGAPTPYVTIQGITLPTTVLPPLIDLANGTLSLPDVVATGGLDADGVLRASGSDMVLDLNADLDALVPGVPVGGFDLPLGSLAGASFQAYDIEAGPTMALTQDFALASMLMVDLAFSEQVLLEGIGLADRYTGPWEDLPRLAVFGPTLFEPTFWLDSELTATHGLRFGLELDIDVGEVAVNLGPLSGTLGPLYRESFAYDPDFAMFSLFSDSFAFEGFDPIAAAPFRIAPADPGGLAGGPGDVAPIPLPAPFLLLGSALVALPLAGGGRQRRD